MTANREFSAGDANLPEGGCEAVKRLGERAIDYLRGAPRAIRIQGPNSKTKSLQIRQWKQNKSDGVFPLSGEMQRAAVTERAGHPVGLPG